MNQDYHNDHALIACQSIPDVTVSGVRRRRERLPNTQSPKERALWKGIRKRVAEKLRQKRDEQKRAVLGGRTFNYATRDGLKRGPKIDENWHPDDKCTAIISGTITPREMRAFELARLAHQPFPPTRSAFLRFLMLAGMRTVAVPTRGKIVKLKRA